MEAGGSKGGGGTRWGLPDEARAQSPGTDEELQRLNGGRLNGVKSGGETFGVTAAVQQETGPTSRWCTSDGWSLVSYK